MHVQFILSVNHLRPKYSFAKLHPHLSSSDPTDEAVVVISDGWAGSHQSLKAGEGYVSLSAYNDVTMGPYLASYSFSVDLDAIGLQPSEILLNAKNWDPTESLVSLEAS